MLFIQGVSIRKRIFFTLLLLVAVNLAGSGVTLWYVHRTQTLYSETIAEEIAALTVAQKLENTLAEQKGLVTYYSLSHNQDWLERLEELKTAFGKWLDRARDTSTTNQGRELLNRIESSYLHFAFSRDKVIELYRQGQTGEAAQLHPKVREEFSEVYALCDDYKRLHEHLIVSSAQNFRESAGWISTLAFAAMPCSVLLGAFLAWVFLREIIRPIRKLAYGEGDTPAREGDELQALSDKMHALMQNVDKVQSKLDRSREQMQQTEKLAVVGKMAAGVAHTIRNPLTSVKMRLFTLERSLELDHLQKEDFDVIGEEIRHIDAILRNFLEFSRPPKLQMQPVSPSDVVDMAMQLLRHRFETYNVSVSLKRHARLPQIMGDPDRLKEAIMNILLNACEALSEKWGEKGGEIVISEEEGFVEPWGRVCILRIRDNGPGIPQKVRDHVMEPFFSTKEDGTGLGLSIVTRIMEEHGGWVHLNSQEGEGTTFVLGLPCKDKEAWLRS